MATVPAKSVVPGSNGKPVSDIRLLLHAFPFLAVKSPKYRKKDSQYIKLTFNIGSLVDHSHYSKASHTDLDFPLSSNVVVF
jgi:hypothetical protein